MIPPCQNLHLILSTIHFVGCTACKKVIKEHKRKFRLLFTHIGFLHNLLDEVAIVKEKVGTLNEVTNLRKEVGDLKELTTEIANLRKEVGILNELKNITEELRKSITELKEEIAIKEK